MSERICECEHSNNCHADGRGKCIFAQLHAASGRPAEECPCLMFVEKAVAMPTKSAPPKPEDALQRQLTEMRRRDHEAHLSRYRMPDPNRPH